MIHVQYQYFPARTRQKLSCTKNLLRQLDSGRSFKAFRVRKWNRISWPRNRKSSSQF